MPGPWGVLAGLDARKVVVEEDMAVVVTGEIGPKLISTYRGRARCPHRAVLRRIRKKFLAIRKGEWLERPHPSPGKNLPTKNSSKNIALIIKHLRNFD